MPAEIAQAMNERHPDEPIDETEVLEFIDSIEPAMWERSIGEKNLAVLERIRDERKGRIDQSSMLYITFKAWDPDKTLTKLNPYLSWMFTPGFVIFCVLLFIASFYLIAGDWTRVLQDTMDLYSFQNKTAYDIWAFWILMFVLTGIHELGHGLTCKHFGGDVHQMGFMLIYFGPAFYTDTTDILLFQRGSRRLWVIFAGIWIELVNFGIATFIWRFTIPGTIVNDLAYKTMLLSGIQAALINLNPLIKADGYYALSQFLDIDNMREESFAFLRTWSRKYLLRQEIDLPPTSRRQRRIFITFGIAAILYSGTLILLAILFVRNIFVSRFGGWGYVLTAGVVYFFARKGLRSALPTVRAWVREKREGYMAWKITRTQQVGALGVVLLLVIPPLPSKLSTDFVVEPGRDARVRAEVAGLVREVYVRQDDAVKAGQLLAVLQNPEVEAGPQILSQQLALASSDVRSSQDRADTDKSAQASLERIRLQQELAVAKKKVESLEIRAPFAGIVTTPQIEQKVGEYLTAGDEFTRIVDRGTMKARILVRDWELEEIRPGAAAQVKVLPFPYRTYSGRVEQILPAAALDRPVAQPEKLEHLGQELTNYFAVIMNFPNPDGSLREGMTGTAKITGKSRSLGWRAGREAWRWAHSQIW
jgi:putative peptide zinc metalloprotease protein